jgi:hypothetical protein
MRIWLEPVESTWETVAKCVDMAVAWAASDKSINNQSLVSIVRFLLYYHMSSAELKDRGKSLDAENAKRKWFGIGSNYGGRGLCGSPSRLPPLNVFKLSQFGTKRREVLVF